MRIHRISVLFVCIPLLALAVGTHFGGVQRLDFSKIPARGMVTMIDLDAKNVFPAK